MFCSRCGNEVAEQSGACPHCGAALESAPASPSPVDPPPGHPGAAVVDPLAKSKIVAGILGLVIGSLGIHRFYLGYTGIGILQIVVSLVTCGAGGIWGFIEGILILVGSTITTDADGRPLRD